MLMKLQISSNGSFTETESWLKRLQKPMPSGPAKIVGQLGVSGLRSGTPKDRGITASGWDYEVVQTGGGADVYWKNTANPQLSINLAMAIQHGHGTGTGGYVPPIDYINPAIDGLAAKAGDLILKELMR